jgi:two-component system response regulator VanR
VKRLDIRGVSTMRVLLAEDDTDVLDVTTYALRKYGYDVVGVTDGAAALKRWETEQPDLVLLDVNLPTMSGMDVCQKIRERSTTPVLMVSGLADEDHIVEGFERGADDYLCKPVSYRQLAMRMRAVLQRRNAGEPVVQSSATAVAADISVDLQYHEVSHADRPLKMTRLETRILYLLVSNARRVITTERLIEFAWNYEGGDAFALKTHISHIRQKLALSSGEPGYISSVPRVGYKLQAA